MKLSPLYYPSPRAWRDARSKRVLLFAMSGLGKTYLASMLRDEGGWFHYSIDYRIGTRYMGELIADSFKREAMKVPYLRNLLLSDSIYIGSNITFNNLAPLSTYLGKPGDPGKGGLPIAEYRKRQAQHRAAEISTLMDTPHFIERAEDIYGYPNFVADTGGSICEVVDPGDPADPVLTTLAQNCLMVWIEGNHGHAEELARRFDRAPKPMYYQPEFLDRCWSEYLKDNNLSETAVDPDAFVRWTYAQALAHRQPRYAAMAKNWGVTVSAAEASAVQSASDFEDMVATALERATA